MIGLRDGVLHPAVRVVSHVAVEGREKGVPKGELNPQETDASSSHKQLTPFRDGGGGGGVTGRGRTGTIQKPFPSARCISSLVHADRSLAEHDPYKSGETHRRTDRDTHGIQTLEECDRTVCRTTQGCYEMKH